MIKILTRTILVIFIAFLMVNTASAFSLGQFFGGSIFKTKANQIQILESQGYSCPVPGETIDIKPIKGPISYLIKYSTRSKTNTQISRGQQILGRYTGKTTITCTKPCPPPPGNECTSTVTLDTITLFGTSIR